jgi:hypothetical protein
VVSRLDILDFFEWHPQPASQFLGAVTALQDANQFE